MNALRLAQGACLGVLRHFCTLMRPAAIADGLLLQPMICGAKTAMRIGLCANTEQIAHHRSNLGQAAHWHAQQAPVACLGVDIRPWLLAACKSPWPARCPCALATARLPRSHPPWAGVCPAAYPAPPRCPVRLSSCLSWCASWLWARSTGMEAAVFPPPLRFGRVRKSSIDQPLIWAVSQALLDLADHG